MVLVIHAQSSGHAKCVECIGRLAINFCDFGALYERGHRSGFALPWTLRSLCVLFFAYIKRRLDLTMLVSAAREPVPLRPSLACRGRRVVREALPSKSIWFVKNLELLTLNTYGLCVFLELVGGLKCRCK